MKPTNLVKLDKRDSGQIVGLGFPFKKWSGNK